MDNNNLPPTMPPSQPLAAPQDATTQQPPMVATGTSGLPITPQPVPPPATGGSKMGMWLIILAFVVVAILLGGGIYMYMSSKSKSETTTVEPAQTKTVDDVKGLSTDVDNVEVGTPEAKFEEIDKDLNAL